jgi:hypothetical protein
MYWLLGLLFAVPGYLHALGINIITNDILVNYIIYNNMLLIYYIIYNNILLCFSNFYK